MYNLKKLCPAAKWHLFSQKFLVNPDWKYYQKIATQHQLVMIFIKASNFLMALTLGEEMIANAIFAI